VHALGAALNRGGNRISAAKYNEIVVPGAQLRNVVFHSGRRFAPAL
jgi:hypothetical protein